MAQDSIVLLFQEGEDEETIIDGETYFPSPAVPAYRKFSLDDVNLPNPTYISVNSGQHVGVADNHGNGVQMNPHC